MQAVIRYRRSSDDCEDLHPAKKSAQIPVQFEIQNFVAFFEDDPEKQT